MWKLFNYITDSIVGLVIQVALMALFCKLFYGMDLLMAILFIQFSMIILTIYNLMVKFNQAVRDYIYQD